MNKKKRAKDILFLFFLIILIIIQFFLIKYYKKDNKINLYSEVARWSFGLNNSGTAIKLSDEKLCPGSERKI